MRSKQVLQAQLNSAVTPHRSLAPAPRSLPDDARRVLNLAYHVERVPIRRPPRPTATASAPRLPSTLPAPVEAGPGMRSVPRPLLLPATRCGAFMPLARAPAVYGRARSPLA